MSGDNRPIGIFDSGVGGLTVAAELIKAMPNENIVYFGDTARVPYGSKSKETVTKFSAQIVRYLLTRNVKCVVIACGTASSNSYDELKAMFGVPLFEMVTPAASAGAAATTNKKIGVIGTEATIKSGAYEKAVLAIDKNIEVFKKACPLFVPLAEEGWTENEIAQLTAEKYLKDFLDYGMDTLILGCTHYPLLINCINKVTGRKQRDGSLASCEAREPSPCFIINPAEHAAVKVKAFLRESGLERTDPDDAERLFFVSDNTEKFNRISKASMDVEYKAKKVDIEGF